jgi:general stress protein YciG
MAQGQGFQSMSEEDRKAAASKGGQMSGGKFTKGDPRASAAGKKGAAAQPTEAKRRGGMNSHRND